MCLGGLSCVRMKLMVYAALSLTLHNVCGRDHSVPEISIWGVEKETLIVDVCSCTLALV